MVVMTTQLRKRDVLTTQLLPLLLKTRTGTTTTPSLQIRKGGLIHETFTFSKTGRMATAKWLSALTTANRKKNAATLDLRGK